MELSLKSRLERYLRSKPNQWFAKGYLCDLARNATGATGEATGRRLRELENDGIVSVTYKKGHAYYQASNERSELIKSVQSNYEIFDNLPSR